MRCHETRLNSGQLCMSTEAEGPRSRGLGSVSCLQVVNIHQTKYSMCEISRTVKTNRGRSRDGGEGWEMYTLEEEEEEKKGKERRGGLTINDITVCQTHTWRKLTLCRYMPCLHQSIFHPSPSLHNDVSMLLFPRCYDDLICLCKIKISGSWIAGWTPRCLKMPP